MFLSNKPTSRLTTAAKARLNTHSHKLDNIEPRKRSPDGNNGPPSPSEVIVFNNTNHSGNNRGQNAQSQNLPEVPQYEEIQRFLKEIWDRKMHEMKTQNLKVKWIKSEKEELAEAAALKDGISSPPQAPTPKQKNSPQHSYKK